ncbi:MAG: phage regulatory CII family protein [Pseudomonadota bacterium]|nr:phage regulatory CII family protein [Pseudomonadota bacterium]
MDKQPVRDMDAYIDPAHDAAFANVPKRLAVDMGMSAKSLYRRLDENDAMPLRFIDFVALFWSVDEESRKAMIQPFLDDMGMVAVERIQAESVAKGDIFGAVLDGQSESGKLASLIHQVIEDDVVDDDEAADLDRQFREIEAATARLKAQLEAKRKPTLKAVNQ